MTSQAQEGVLIQAAAIAAALAPIAELPARCAEVDRLLERLGPRFSVEAAEALVAGLDEKAIGATAPERMQLAEWAAKAEGNATPASSWVRARLMSLLGSEGAAEAWNECLNALPGVVPEGLLHRCRARLKTGDAEGAAGDLRLALQQPAGYDLWTRAEKLERRLRRVHQPAMVRELRLAVLSGKASTSLLVPLLRLACFRDGIGVEIYESDYDSYRQEILDEASGLYRFAPDVVLVAAHWRDAELPVHSPDPDAEVDALVERMTGLWRTLRDRHPCTLVFHGFDLPAADAWGRLSAALPGGRTAVLRRANQALHARAGDGVVILDLERAAATAGRSDWVDAGQWLSARQHPASRGLVALVESQVATLRAVVGLSKKVVVVDLDNTLWGGVIGEDGLEGIELGPPSAAGEAYQELQHYLRQLRDRGIVLAVCSKNNEDDARRPFEAHAECVLALDDFVMFVANWEDKASNLRHIAETLALGLDSFVFLDDNPVERAWVRSQLPEVLVPELPEDPARYVESLDRGQLFEATALSEEDRVRHESYRAALQHDRLRQQSGSLDDFLRDLHLVARRGPFDAPNLARITQLVNKTNQFNLVTRRYTEAQLRAQADDPLWWTQWFRLADRFRDNGLIGVLTAKPCEGDDTALEMDNWLMSCRVLGRRMEAYMLRCLLEHCREGHVKTLYGRFLRTAKNAQVADLYPRMGFEPAESDGQGTRWVIDVASAELPECPIEPAAD